MVYRLAQILVLATFVLLFVGGLVTSTDSGLAVPDWPLSYGSLFPPMIGGIRYEHTHRLIASLVGLLTFILMIWTGVKETRPWVRRLAIACFGAVVLQGILGGLTVLFLLPAAISVAHACIGPLFFSLVVSLAVLTSPHRHCPTGAIPILWNKINKWDCEAANQIRPKQSQVSDCFVGPSGLLAMTKEKRFHLLSLVTTLFIFLQILLGAVVRHTNKGMWLHVSSAFLVFFLAGLVTTQALNQFSEEKQILKPALFLGFLVMVEFFLGIGAFVFTQIGGIQPALGQILFPTLHQTLGTLILATGVVLTLRSGLWTRSVTV